MVEGFKRANYECPRCGYSTNHKTSMMNHLYKAKKTCPASKNYIDLDDSVKEYIIQNRVYPISKTNNKPKKSKTETDEKFKKVCFALQCLSEKKNETFYQLIVEKYLNGQHKSLPDGSITDVTNDTTHAEIKCWEQHKAAVGQLLWYNEEDPKSELHLYLFGRIPKKKYKHIRDRVVNFFKIKLFTFQVMNDSVSIINQDDEIVYTYSTDVNEIIKTIPEQNET